MGEVRPPEEDGEVTAFWRALGVPGLADIHTYFLPPRMLRKVRDYFDAAGPLVGARWPIRYKWSDEERAAHLRGLGVRMFSALAYAHRPDMDQSGRAVRRACLADHPFGVRDGRCGAGSHCDMRARSGRAWVLLACAAAIAVVALAGCGSGKPGYCTDRANLENSIKGLSNLNGSGISGLKSQLTQIQSDANALVNSAKSDFPNETSAISSSVSALKDSVTALPSGPSVAQVAAVTKDAANVVSSVKSFTDATGSQCN